MIKEKKYALRCTFLLPEIGNHFFFSSSLIPVKISRKINSSQNNSCFLQRKKMSPLILIRFFPSFFSGDYLWSHPTFGFKRDFKRDSSIFLDDILFFFIKKVKIFYYKRLKNMKCRRNFLLDVMMLLYRYSNSTWIRYSKKT